MVSEFLELEDTISISVERDKKLVANVLFTPFIFLDSPEKKCYLLAPLGVLPEFQRKGVGRELMHKAITYLKSIGTDAIFVLGVPGFYPKYGFVQTDKETPYPNLLSHPESWMALELTKNTLKSLGGKTLAVDPFMKKIFWDTSEWN